MSAARRHRILVVDEDKSMRDCLELHLRSAGYEVVTAADAIAAGHEILRRPPDALIAEADLRYMSGIELAATMVADTSLPVIPVILLSSQADLPAQAEALATACLIKPFLRDELLEAVDGCFRGSPALARPALKLAS